MKLCMGNIAVVQAGGPTSVLNSSLAAFIEASIKEKDGKIIGFCNGIEGLYKDRTIDLRLLDNKSLKALKYQPGAALGSGRFSLKEEDWFQVRDVLRKHKIDQLALMGGNGTMWSASKIASLAPEIQVVGIPKTIDNDLWGTDHAPGYLSAAKFVAEAIRSLGFDLWSMQNFEKVRIVEVMGRNVGWLAAAANLTAKKMPGFPQILVYPPELTFNLEEFITTVLEYLSSKSCLIVVVSEGVHDSQGVPIAEQEIGGDNSKKIPGGVGLFLAKKLRQIGIPCRHENLGILQRANTWSVSKRDRQEAMLLGNEAVKALQQGVRGKMLGLKGPGLPLNKDSIQYVTLEEIAGRERPLDFKYISDKEGSTIFTSWLESALDEDLGYEESAQTVWKIALQTSHI